jgi:phosphoribosylformylglycinamidine cyclo-ligase
VADLGETVGEALLRPHLSYLDAVAPLLEQGVIKGMAHITGGGITENLPRVLPEGRGFSLDRGSWTIPPLFSWLQHAGGLEDTEAFRAFNMGVGLVLVAAPGHVDSILASLKTSPHRAWLLGRIV